MQAEQRSGLSGRVRGLLSDTIAAYAGRPGQQRLHTLARHLDEPRRVAIAGRVKAGKSTLLNALVGQRVAATDAGECTRVVTWYTHAPLLRASACPRLGAPVDLRLRAQDGELVLDLGGYRPEDLDRLQVELPSTWLTRRTLIDTPGMGSLSAEVASRTTDFLAGSGDRTGSGNVDAVLYLLRQLHTCDVEFFEAFHDTALSHTPVNAVGVLSRADEVGGGSASAIADAQLVAARYRQDPRLRALVHTVVPVAGLLAEAAAALREEEFADLAALAAGPEAVLAPLLLSAARFTSHVGAVSVPPARRQRLLQLLGLYGVRLSLEIIRRGGAGANREHLATTRRDHSGLPELCRLLLTPFAQRRDVLKADSTLRAIDSVTAADPIPAARQLRQQIEQIRVSAHELAELRLLTELRTGLIPAPPERLVSMERLLGGDGTAATTRLGLEPDASDVEISGAITSLHTHWRRVAQNRLTDPALARAANVLLRTCEGLTASPGRSPAGS